MFTHFGMCLLFFARFDEDEKSKYDATLAIWIKFALVWRKYGIERQKGCRHLRELR